MDFHEKIAVITGASSGIGRATALELARRGAHVVLAARRAELLENVAGECRKFGVRAQIAVTDVRDRDACRNLIAAAGDVDILVNNAGFAIYDSSEEARIDEMRDMMDTNFFGTVHCTQAVLPLMLSRKRGSIVNVGSITGIMGFARMGGYCASKFAISGWTEALRDEVIGKGVSVALVCPATTDTEFFVKAERGKQPAASRLMLAVPPQRVARAICASAADGRYRRILPVTATMYMRFKELAPNAAHVMFRRLTRLMERR